MKRIMKNIRKKKKKKRKEKKIKIRKNGDNCNNPEVEVTESALYDKK